MALPANSPRSCHQAALRRGDGLSASSLICQGACDQHLLEKTLPAGHNVHVERHLL